MSVRIVGRSQRVGAQLGAGPGGEPGNAPRRSEASADRFVPPGGAGVLASLPARFEPASGERRAPASVAAAAAAAIRPEPSPLGEEALSTRGEIYDRIYHRGEWRFDDATVARAVDTHFMQPSGGGAYLPIADLAGDTEKTLGRVLMYARAKELDATVYCDFSIVRGSGLRLPERPESVVAARRLCRAFGIDESIIKLNGAPLSSYPDETTRARPSDRFPSARPAPESPPETGPTSGTSAPGGTRGYRR